MLGVGVGVARRVRILGVAVFFAGTIMAGLSAAAPAAPSTAEAGAFLADLSQRAIAELSAPGLAEDEKQRRFRALLNQGFDIEAMARFILGRYWRTAKEPERQEFLQVFEDSIVFRFMPILGDYAGTALQVGTVRSFGKTPGLFNVETQIARSEGPPVRVNWRVYKGTKGFRVLDILAEGVSVAVTLRSEYGSVLKQNGGRVSALNRILRDKISGL